MIQNNVNIPQFGKTYSINKSLLGKLSSWTIVPLKNYPLSLGQSNLGQLLLLLNFTHHVLITYFHLCYDEISP